MFREGSSNSTGSRNQAEFKRRFIVLTLTENCNLDCVYCYEKAKTKAVMDIQVAKDALEHEFNNSDGFDEIEIDLFGGEPTLCKEFIVELVNWTYQRKFNKPALFFLETNGTLIHGEFKTWLLGHRNHVNVGLSLDGTPETHNTNRSNSYSRIDVDFFAKHYPEQAVRMTINSSTVSNLSNDVIYLHRLGFRKIDASFACGIDWSASGLTEDLRRELENLCDYYLTHPEVRECSIFDMHLPDLLQKEEKVQKRCGTGTSMVSIATDGKRYPCHTFQPNTTANPVALGRIDFGKIEDFRDLECSNCILEPACPTCYGINHHLHGDILRRDKQFCRVMKIRALAVSYLRAKQIEKGLEKMEPAELYQTIKAIQMVQTEFPEV